MTQEGRPDGFAHSRAYDLVFAAPFATVYAFAVVGNVILIGRQWDGAASWAQTLTILDEAAMLVFFGLQAVLFLVRRLPVAKSYGFAPRAVAAIGSNLNFALLLLPRVALGPFWLAISSALVIVGTAGAIAILFWLGRAFSIFPEARNFVASGPYRFVRHPLYLAEIVGTLGIMLGFRQPWALLIALATIGFQLRRMTVEEQVLGRIYPAYDAYSRTTPRLIPGLY